MNHERTSTLFMPPTNPPVLAIVWPHNGGSVCGDSLTVRARLSDPTATIAVQIMGGDATNTAAGIVGRKGKVWAENLPLAAGTNSVTLIATDVATNTTMTNFAVVRSALELAISPLDPAGLNQPYVTVEGTICAQD